MQYSQSYGTVGFTTSQDGKWTHFVNHSKHNNEGSHQTVTIKISNSHFQEVTTLVHIWGCYQMRHGWVVATRQAKKGNIKLFQLFTFWCIGISNHFFWAHQFLQHPCNDLWIYQMRRYSFFFWVCRGEDPSTDRRLRRIWISTHLTYSQINAWMLKKLMSPAKMVLDSTT